MWKNAAVVGRRFRAWSSRVAILVVTLAGLGGMYAWRFDRWVRSLRFYDAAHEAQFASKEFPFLSEQQIVQLGAAHTVDDHPDSSYILHSEAKAPGVIRIGVFGCSFVKGEEAAPGFDVPSLLDQALHEACVSRVEVLNFGVSGYGFHQAYLLWKYLHERFELDYTVFFLFGFHAERDTTFVMLDDIYAPVHARYALEDGRPRLVEVLGGDRREASQRYFRVLPAWRYLRYDLKAPPCLRALLPAGRAFRNPFYYRGDTAHGVEELFGLLVSDLHLRAPNLVVLCDRGAPLRNLRNLPQARRFVSASAALQLALSREDLYVAPRRHLSALGNLVVSRELLALLTGSRRLTAPSIGYTAVRQRAAFRAIDSLDSFDSVTIAAGGKPLGILVMESSPPWRVFSPHSPPVSSLLDVSDRRHLTFVPLSREFPPRQPLRIIFMTSEGPVRFPIGRVVADTPVFGWMKRNARAVAESTHGWTVDWDPNTSPLELKLRGPTTPRDVELSIGDTPILRGVPEPDASKDEDGTHLRLEPIGAQLVCVRGHSSQSLQALQSRGGGVVELVLNRCDESTIRVPIRGFRLTDVQLPNLTTSIDHPIVLSEP